MRKWLGTVLFFALLSGGCPAGKYDKLADAPGEKTAASAFWNQYLSKLSDKQVSKDPIQMARFFSGPLLARTQEAEFKKRIAKTQKKQSAGAFERVEVVSVKDGPGGLLIIVDSKAGQAAIPIVKEDDKVRFAELAASTGDWAKEAKHGPDKMPDEPSILYIKWILSDTQSPLGKRLQAAVALSKPQYRSVIISQQKKVRDPVVRLGLGLARIKIDGSDASFLRNFPTNAEGMQTIANADKAIFDEMITKLSNMGGLVEDPPANEIMYKVAAGAPPAMRDQMASALYKMAELNPARMANAVRNVATDPQSDTTLDIYLEEVKRKGGKAPKMTAFLKKFSRIGEGEERKLCKTLLSRIAKAR
jgi:hypothetical protein